MMIPQVPGGRPGVFRPGSPIHEERKDAPPGSPSKARIRARTPPPAVGGTPRPGALSEMRRRPSRARAKPVSDLRREGTGRRTRTIRRGKGGRHVLRRTEFRGPPAHGAGEEEETSPRTTRGGALHPLRGPSPRRGRRRLRTLPRGAASGRAGTLRRKACQRALRTVRGVGFRRFALRPVRSARGGARQGEEERSPTWALRPSSRLAALHRLRRAIRRSGEVRGLRAAFVSLLGRA